MLGVVCGRRPNDLQQSDERIYMLGWVLECSRSGGRVSLKWLKQNWGENLLCPR